LHYTSNMDAMNESASSKINWKVDLPGWGSRRFGNRLVIHALNLSPRDVAGGEDGLGVGGVDGDGGAGGPLGGGALVPGRGGKSADVGIAWLSAVTPLAALAFSAQVR
jgi:hypothetical protein